MTVMMRDVLAVLVAGAGLTALATSEPPVPLWPEGKMPSVQTNQTYRPFLVWHTPERLQSKAILIAVSGGGYVSSDVTGFEVVPIRDYFLDRGVTVVTMRYRCPRPAGQPKHLTAWQDVQRTVRLVRSEAERRGLSPDRIGFTGCSAGGHLTMLVAVSSRTSAYSPVDEIDRVPCNVNWAIPVYPAYLLTDGAERNNVRKGNDLSDGLVSELAFDADTPPMCFFHGDADGWSAMNSVRAYHRLRTMGIPAEIHVMALEGHCFQSDPRPGTSAATWKDRVWEWLTSIDALSAHPQVWRKEWTPVFPLWSGSLDKQADFEPGSWEKREWGGSRIVSKKPASLTLKGDFADFAADFEYRTENLVGASVALGEELAIMLSGDSEIWHRMTVWRKGDVVKRIVDGRECPETLTLDSRRRCRIEFRTTGGGFLLRSVHIRRSSLM